MNMLFKNFALKHFIFSYISPFFSFVFPQVKWPKHSRLVQSYISTEQTNKETKQNETNYKRIIMVWLAACIPMGEVSFLLDFYV